jgi:hypothetical protein
VGEAEQADQADYVVRKGLVIGARHLLADRADEKDYRDTMLRPVAGTQAVEACGAAWSLYNDCGIHRLGGREPGVRATERGVPRPRRLGPRSSRFYPPPSSGSRPRQGE